MITATQAVLKVPSIHNSFMVFFFQIKLYGSFKYEDACFIWASILLFLDLVGPLRPRRGVSTSVRHDFDTLLSQLHRYEKLTRLYLWQTQKLILNRRLSIKSRYKNNNLSLTGFSKQLLHYYYKLRLIFKSFLNG